jgi:hypothetical protein
LATEPAIRLGVDPAHEERRDRRDVRNVTTVVRKPFQPAQVCIDHFVVAREREDQRDVDVDPGRSRVFDRGEPFERRRDLDHHVRAVEPAEQIRGLRNGSRSVVPEIRVDLDRHEPVATVRLVVDRSEQVGRVRDVVEDEGPVHVLDVGPGAGALGELLVVVGPGGHCLFEDRRVRGDAANAVFVDEHPKTTAGERTSEVVVPGALTELEQLLDRAHCDISFAARRSRNARARCATLSGV